MPDEVRACRARRASRGYVLHSPGVVPSPTLSSFGVENVDKFRPNLFEQTTKVRRADASAGETIRRHGHDEVWKTRRHHFQRKMTIAILGFKAQRIKKGSFFVLAQHPPECRAALLHGDAISALPHAYGIETYLSGGQGENERSRVAARSLHFVEDGAGTKCRMPGKREFFFYGKHSRIKHAWLSRGSQEDRLELAELLCEPKHEPGAELASIGKDGEAVAGEWLTRKDIDMAVWKSVHLWSYLVKKDL
jgi:hypothetical protein